MKNRSLARTDIGETPLNFTKRTGLRQFLARAAAYSHIGWVIFAVALLVRLAILAATPANLISFNEEESLNIAKSLAFHHAFANPFPLPTGPTAHVPPGFPWVMAVVFGIFGDGLAGGIVRCILISAEFSALFALLPMAAATMGLAREAGVLAGFAAAIYPFFWRIEVTLGRDDALSAIFLLLLTAWTYRIATSPERPRLRTAILYGVTWGVMLHVQSSGVTLLAAYLAIIVFLRRPFSRRIAFGAVTFATVILVIAPWTIRNRVVMGQWLFMRDNAGFEIASSNRDQAKASLQEEFFANTFCDTHPICNDAVDRRIAREGEIRFNREEMQVGLNWIRTHPARFARLTAVRAMYFWTDLPFYKLNFAGRTLLSLLGFAGIVLMWRRRLFAQATIFSAAWLIYPSVYYLFRYMTRYVAPMYGLLLLPAGFFAYEILLNRRRSGNASATTAIAEFEATPSPVH